MRPCQYVWPPRMPARRPTTILLAMVSKLKIYTHMQIAHRHSGAEAHTHAHDQPQIWEPNRRERERERKRAWVRQRGNELWDNCVLAFEFRCRSQWRCEHSQNRLQSSSNAVFIFLFFYSSTFYWAWNSCWPTWIALKSRANELPNCDSFQLWPIQAQHICA